MSNLILPKGVERTDEIEIIESSVIVNTGEEMTLFSVRDCPYIKGIAVPTPAIESGLVKKQDIIDVLSQEYLNNKYGMKPARRSIVIPGRMES
jgi:hypothetical protein